MDRVSEPMMPWTGRLLAVDNMPNLHEMTAGADRHLLRRVAQLVIVDPRLHMNPSQVQNLLRHELYGPAWQEDAWVSVAGEFQTPRITPVIQAALVIRPRQLLTRRVR